MSLSLSLSLSGPNLGGQREEEVTEFEMFWVLLVQGEEQVCMCVCVCLPTCVCGCMHTCKCVWVCKGSSKRIHILWPYNHKELVQLSSINCASSN